MTDSVYFASGRTIVAMDRRNGRETWRTELPMQSWWTGLVIRMLLVQGKELFVATNHAVRCLDRYTGAQLWQQDILPTGPTVQIGVSGADSGVQQASGAANV